jgi:hypothetical protein
MEFLTSKDLKLNAAGYLVSSTSNKPVNHESFVAQQKSAEYVVKLAEAIKGKNFKTGKVDSLDEIKKAVLDSINKTNTKTYVNAPTKPTSKVQDELTELALAFVQYDEKKDEVSQINQMMAQFSAIDAVESVGDYFSEGLTKLNAIYSVEEILAAVTANVEKLK